MTVTAEYAAKHFDELLAAMEGGSSIEIIRPDKPTLRLTSEPSEAEPHLAAKRVLGAGVGELRVPSDEEWDEMDKEWRKSFASKFGDDAEC
jgi:antitoxin (DNA-binding transcriptional repressor) of toxin-antitoxin stability system